MAKNSAKSKGYRKQVKKKPFLTKKEIIELIVILAVILLGVILFNTLYDDGFTKKVEPGEVVAYAGENLRDRYKKLADIGEVEGFTLEDRPEGTSPITTYDFLPNDENSTITSVSVSGSFLDADSLVSATISYMQNSLDSISEVQETTIQGHDAKVFAYTYSHYDPSFGLEEGAEIPVMTEEELAAQEPNRYCQNVNAYISIDDTHTLCLHIYSKDVDNSFYLEDAQLLDFVKAHESAFTAVQAD